MRSRARTLLDKSIGAMLAAIEVYNKPDFAYRVETFSILAVNSWELLLKSRILQLDGNNLDSIIEYEKRRKKNGEWSKKLYRKEGRSGNHVTIGLFKAFDKLVNEYGDTIDPVVRANLEALTEIRDNSVHFINRGVVFAKAVQEIGTANLKNYLSAVRQWFGVDMSGYNFFLMPLAFFRDFRTGTVVALSANEQKLLSYLSDLQKSVPNDDETRDFNLALRLDIKFRRTGSAGQQEVRVTNDPTATPVRLEEEDIRERYPWTYAILAKRLQARYKDFKANADFHRIRRPLERNLRYCRVRLLDPGNPKSQRKRFYSTGIIEEFDKHYQRRS